MTEEWPAAPVTEQPGARGPLFVLAVLAAYAVVVAGSGPDRSRAAAAMA